LDQAEYAKYKHQLQKSAKVGDVLIIVTDILKAGRNSFTMFQKIFLYRFS